VISAVPNAVRPPANSSTDRGSDPEAGKVGPLTIAGASAAGTGLIGSTGIVGIGGGNAETATVSPSLLQAPTAGALLASPL